MRKPPDAALPEVAGRVGVRGSRGAIVGAPRPRAITREKESLHARGRDAPRVRRKRRASREAVAPVDPAHRAFSAGTGADTARTRTTGRAPRGQRVRGSVPGHWESVTWIAGVRLSGVVASLAFPGASDTPAFERDVARALAPRLRPAAVVIGGNLKPHQAAGARRAVEGAGASWMPLPPYRADRTPSEGLFAAVKGWRRSAAARTTEAVSDARGAALRAVCRGDILGWFKSCGEWHVLKP